MEAVKDRPPYVTFEQRPVEDRDASIAAGHYVARDVDFAIITPAGSKDKIERVATEWLDYIRDQAREERFPEEWARAFRAKFEDYKKGLETPPDGTSVRNWPAVSPAQLRCLVEANILTVEDLAVANESALGAIGMGARMLQQKAKDFLAAASGPGVVSERLTAMETTLAKLEADNLTKDEQIAELKKQLAAAQKDK